MVGALVVSRRPARPEDADPLHTALRELEEECGIRLGREQMEAALPVVLARRKTGPFLPVAPFVFGVERELPTVLDEREAVAAVWIPRSLLCDPAQHCLRPVPHRPDEMLYPAIDLNGVPLWGFTYRLLTDWLALGPKDPKDLIAAVQGRASGQPAWFWSFFSPTASSSGRDGQIAPQRRPGSKRSRWQAWKAQSRSSWFAPALACRAITSPLVNLLEVRPDHIRVAGLDFEEYLISASG